MMFLCYVCLPLEEIRGVKELPAGLMNHVLSCPLWKPVFRHGLSGLPGEKKLALASPDTDQVRVPELWLYVCVSVQKSLIMFVHLFVLQEEPARLGDGLVEFLKDFACWDPSQDSSDGRTELMRAVLMTCKKQPVRNEIAGGLKVDQAVNATWAAMVYHTPALHHSLRSFGN